MLIGSGYALNLLFVPFYHVQEIPSGTEMPVAEFVFKICMSVEYHQTTIFFRISHGLLYTVLQWNADEHMDMIFV